MKATKPKRRAERNAGVAQVYEAMAEKCKRADLGPIPEALVARIWVVVDEVRARYGAVAGFRPGDLAALSALRLARELVHEEADRLRPQIFRPALRMALALLGHVAIAPRPGFLNAWLREAGTPAMELRAPVNEREVWMREATWWAIGLRPSGACGAALRDIGRSAGRVEPEEAENALLAAMESPDRKGARRGAKGLLRASRGTFGLAEKACRAIVRVAVHGAPIPPVDQPSADKDTKEERDLRAGRRAARRDADRARGQDPALAVRSEESDSDSFVYQPGGTRDDPAEWAADADMVRRIRALLPIMFRGSARATLAARWIVEERLGGRDGSQAEASEIFGADEGNVSRRLKRGIHDLSRALAISA